MTETNTDVNAEKKDPEYYLELGYAFRYGWGTEPDLKKALTYFQKSAESGNSSAMFCLAQMSFNGEGCEQNYDNAVKWYEKAADAGNENAAYNLGVMYEEGLGVKQDYSKAFEYRSKQQSLAKLKRCAM